MSLAYFAFVRRDEQRRYHAVLPDFPGCRALAERLDLLDDAIRAGQARYDLSGKRIELLVGRIEEKAQNAA